MKRLWISSITYTGEVKNKNRPFISTIVIKAKTMDDACKATAYFAKRKWPYWRFEIRMADNKNIIEATK